MVSVSFGWLAGWVAATRGDQEPGKGERSGDPVPIKNLPNSESPLNALLLHLMHAQCQPHHKKEFSSLFFYHSHSNYSILGIMARCATSGTCKLCVTLSCAHPSSWKVFSQLHHSCCRSAAWWPLFPKGMLLLRRSRFSCLEGMHPVFLWVGINPYYYYGAPN